MNHVKRSRKLIAAVLFLAALEWGVLAPVYRAHFQTFDNAFYPPSRVPTVDETVVEWKLRYCREGTLRRSHYETVFLGDSSCLMGLVPEVYSELSGENAVNLGTVGYISTWGYVDVMRNYLGSHENPRRVIISLSLYPLAQDEGEIARIGFLSRVHKWLGSGPSDASTSSAWGNPFQLIPSVRHREEVSSVLLSYLIDPTAFHLIPRGIYGSDFDMRREIHDNDGYVEERYRIEDWSSPARFKGPLADYARRGLEQLLGYLRDKGIPVTLVLTPLPEAERNPETEAGYAELARELQGVVSDPNTRLFQEPFVRFLPNDLFGTRVHLNRKGAEHYTEWVVENL